MAGRKAKICSADLDRLLAIQNRDIVAPLDFDEHEASEEFSAGSTYFCKVETLDGKTIFDSAQVETDLTHRFYVRYIPGVTSESWVLFENQRYRIVSVEDIDENHEWLILNCTNRGAVGFPVNDT